MDEQEKLDNDGPNDSGADQGQTASHNKGESAAAVADDANAVSASVPEFASMDNSPLAQEAHELDRFYDVQVPVWAELGRLEMPIGDLLKLGEGAVLRLGRPVTDPVDLVAQGVRLARGEVVVVDDNFAIRIKEIDSTKRQSGS